MGELGSGGGTSYPGVLDTDTTAESGATQVRSNVPNDFGAAIIAIETELGTNPAGSVADLVTRLNVILNDDGTLKAGTTITQAAAASAFILDQNANGISLNIDSEATTANVINIDAINTGGNVLYVYNNGIQTAGNLAYLYQDNANSTIPTLAIRNDGTGNGLFLDQNGNGVVINIDSESTGANVINIDTLTTGGYVLNIDANSVNTGRIINISADGITSAYGLFFDCTSPSMTTGRLLFMRYSTSADGLVNRTGILNQITAERTEQRTAGATTDDYDTLSIDRNETTTGAGGTLTADGSILKLSNALTQTAGTLTTNYHALEISHNSRSASNVYAIEIISNNAGAGNPGGIDMSTFSANEPLLNLPVDVTAEGAYYGRFAVYVTGIGTKYVSLYEA